MDIKQRSLNFDRRWKLIPNPEFAFPRFKNRVLLILDEEYSNFYNSLIAQRFAFIMGLPIPVPNSGIQMERLNFDFAGFPATQIFMMFNNAQNEIELINALQKLFWVLEENAASNITKTQKNKIEKAIQTLAEKLREAIEITPGINILLVRKGNQVTLYPSGAKYLDITVVDDNLEWLGEIPQVRELFRQALIIYQSKDTSLYRNLLDNLRLALEHLLRVILTNKKSFENQENELGIWLDRRGIHTQIRNMYQSLLFGSYRIYQNDAVKHNDASQPQEVEFLIYLTGTFMRLLLQLNGKDHE